jgi:hypothetical protein
MYTSHLAKPPSAGSRSPPPTSCGRYEEFGAHVTGDAVVFPLFVPTPRRTGIRGSSRYGRISDPCTRQVTGPQNAGFVLRVHGLAVTPIAGRDWRTGPGMSTSRA